MKTQDVNATARKKVENLLRFYTHLASYLGVITLLTVLNLTVAGDYFWAVWPIIGWGSAVILHGLFTFVFDSTSSWKERLIEKEIQKRGVQ